MDDGHLRTLISQSGLGDQVAFRELYDYLVDRIYAYIRHRTNNEDDTLDITQEVFIDLYNALARFDYRSFAQFHGFVFLITKRKLAKYYQKTKVELSERADVADEDALPEEVGDALNTDAIARVLEQLPEQTREIVVLHHWSRYTFAEIAACLHMKESAVRVRHHRAMEQLSKILNRQKETV